MKLTNIFKSKKNQTPKKMVFDRLDHIYTACADVAKEWDTDRLPPNTLDEFVNRGMLDTHEVEDVKVKKFMDDFNNVLATLKSTYRRNLKQMGQKQVPLSVFKVYIDHIKISFEEGNTGK